MKNDSTPKEGWAEKFDEFVSYHEVGWHDSNARDLTVKAIPALKDLFSQEIAKARQEVMMTELVHCEEAIERARQEARQEIAEWAKRYDKRNDGINKSDLIKKLEEEK